MEKFTWVDIYNKIAHKLLEYKNNSKALADLMYEVLEESGLMYSEERGSNLGSDGTKRCRYNEIDPIKMSEDNINDIIFKIEYNCEKRKYKEEYNVHYELDKDNLQGRANTKNNELKIISYTLQDLVEKML